MKHQLIFVCDWDSAIKRTWSGTSYSICRSLNKYFNIKNYTLKKGPVHKAYLSLCSRSFLFSYNFEQRIIAKNTKRLLSCLKSVSQDKKLLVFGFHEFPYPANVQSYIYQDANLAFLYDLYKNDPELWKYNNYKRVSEKAMLSRLEDQKEYYKNCAGIFTMSKWLKDYMVEKMGVPAEKIHDVGAGIDVDPSEITGKNRTGKKILFVGRDFNRKGGYLVLKAFNILREKYNPFAELYIVGPKKNPVNQLNTANVNDGIFYLGELSSEELLSLYDTCDIFCMPSYIECFGKVFIEALCCGLPCIVRNSFAMKDIIHDGENGYLIDKDDADDLARKMDMLLSNNEIKTYVNAHRDEYLKNYSWDAVAKRMADIINQNEFTT